MPVMCSAVCSCVGGLRGLWAWSAEGKKYMEIELVVLELHIKGLSYIYRVTVKNGRLKYVRGSVLLTNSGLGLCCLTEAQALLCPTLISLSEMDRLACFYVNIPQLPIQIMKQTFLTEVLQTAESEMFSEQNPCPGFKTRWSKSIMWF